MPLFPRRDICEIEIITHFLPFFRQVSGINLLYRGEYEYELHPPCLFLNNVVLYSELKHCGPRFLVLTFLEDGFRNLSHSTCPNSGSLLRISLPVFCTGWRGAD